MRLTDTKHGGQKRKLCETDGDLLAEPLQWHTRKPSHLKVTKGFLRDDEHFSTVWMPWTEINLYIDRVDEDTQSYLLQRMGREETGGIHLVEEQKANQQAEGRCSKFPSVLTVVLASFYDEEAKQFIPKKLALAAVEPITESHNTIFDMSEEAFVGEYDYWKRTLGVVEVGVERGLFLSDGQGGHERIAGRELLLRLYRLLMEHRERICPNAAAMPALYEAVRAKNFRLHFGNLTMLLDGEAEDLCKPNRFGSIFDLLCDVWVCRYEKEARAYELYYLPFSSWEGYERGERMRLHEFSQGVPDAAAKRRLAFHARIAARRYDFLGCHFILPEGSRTYAAYKGNKVFQRCV